MKGEGQEEEEEEEGRLLYLTCMQIQNACVQVDMISSATPESSDLEYLSM